MAVRVNAATARKLGLTGKAAKSVAKIGKPSITFERLCVEHGIPEPVPEYRFYPPRKWAFDYCWPDHKVALELEGGVWTYGRHNRGKGFVDDIQKYNQAVIQGWRLLRCIPANVNNGSVFAMLKEVLP